MAVASAIHHPKRTKPVRSHYAEKDPDVCLMLRVRGNDSDAFGELLSRFRRQVFAHIYRQIGDREESEDLTQEVFLRLFRYRARYEPRAKFTTWLFHVTQNVARNALRTRRRRPTVQLPDSTGLEQHVHPEMRRSCSYAEAPSRPMERAEVAAVVRTAVASLARRQRRALELHQFQDWTYAEIA